MLQSARRQTRPVESSPHSVPELLAVTIFGSSHLVPPTYTTHPQKMARTKQEKPNIGVKRQHADAYIPLDSAANRPAKKTKLLDDSDDETDGEAGGVSLKVNEEYARRFEHNKKREDKHRCTHGVLYILRLFANSRSGGKVWQIQGATGWR
jgi:hypothetical protein